MPFYYDDCPNGKVLNPQTGNCVQETSSTGRALIRDTCYALGYEYDKKSVSCVVDYAPEIYFWYSPLYTSQTWLSDAPFSLIEKFATAYQSQSLENRKKFIYVLREIVGRLLSGIYRLTVTSDKKSALLEADYRLLQGAIGTDVISTPIAVFTGSTISDIFGRCTVNSSCDLIYNLFVLVLQLESAVSKSSIASMLSETLGITMNAEKRTATLTYRLPRNLSTQVVVLPLNNWNFGTGNSTTNGDLFCDRVQDNFILHHDGKLVCVPYDSLISSLQQRLDVAKTGAELSVEIKVNRLGVKIAIELFDLQRLYYVTAYKGTKIPYKLFFFLLNAPILLSTQDQIPFHVDQKDCHRKFEKSLVNVTDLNERLVLFNATINELNRQGVKSISEWSDECN